MVPGAMVITNPAPPDAKPLYIWARDTNGQWGLYAGPGLTAAPVVAAPPAPKIVPKTLGTVTFWVKRGDENVVEAEQRVEVPVLQMQ